MGTAPGTGAAAVDTGVGVGVIEGVGVIGSAARETSAVAFVGVRDPAVGCGLFTDSVDAASLPLASPSVASHDDAGGARIVAAASAGLGSGAGSGAAGVALLDAAGRRSSVGLVTMYEGAGGAGCDAVDTSSGACVGSSAASANAAPSSATGEDATTGMSGRPSSALASGAPCSGCANTSASAGGGTALFALSVARLRQLGCRRTSRSFTVEGRRLERDARREGFGAGGGEDMQDEGGKDGMWRGPRADVTPGRRSWAPVPRLSPRLPWAHRTCLLPSPTHCCGCSTSCVCFRGLTEAGGNMRYGIRLDAVAQRVCVP
jgi:hypothetical protein